MPGREYVIVVKLYGDKMAGNGIGKYGLELHFHSGKTETTWYETKEIRTKQYSVWKNKMNHLVFHVKRIDR